MIASVSYFTESHPWAETLKPVRGAPHFSSIAVDGAKFGEYMKDAQLMIEKPSLLVPAVNMIDKLPLTKGDAGGDCLEWNADVKPTASSRLVKDYDALDEAGRLNKR